MQDRIRISDDVVVGGQPRNGDLAGLRGEGFASVVNLRTTQEVDDGLRPSLEERAVTDLGMQYLHVPVSMDEMSPELVDRFRDKFKGMGKPAYVHCASGMRAGAFVMMHLGVENGWSGEETLEQARELGFECKKPELKQFVTDYVDNHRKATR